MAGGRPPLPGHSGPRRRVLAGAAGLPGSPHFPHAGSRARLARPLLPRPGARRRPRLCHVLAAAAAARRPAASHAPGCPRYHNTSAEGKRREKPPPRAAASAGCRDQVTNSSPPRCSARTAPTARALSGGRGGGRGPPRPAPRRSPWRAGTRPIPAKTQPRSRRSRFDLAGWPRQRTSRGAGGRACARRHTPSPHPFHTRRGARRVGRWAPPSAAVNGWPRGQRRGSLKPAERRAFKNLLTLRPSSTCSLLLPAAGSGWRDAGYEGWGERPTRGEGGRWGGGEPEGAVAAPFRGAPGRRCWCPASTGHGWGGRRPPVGARSEGSLTELCPPEYDVPLVGPQIRLNNC